MEKITLKRKKVLSLFNLKIFHFFINNSKESSDFFSFFLLEFSFLFWNLPPQMGLYINQNKSKICYFINQQEIYVQIWIKQRLLLIWSNQVQKLRCFPLQAMQQITCHWQSPIIWQFSSMWWLQEKFQVTELAKSIQTVKSFDLHTIYSKNSYFCDQFRNTSS